MTGAALVLSGEAIKLEQQAHPPSLIWPGLVLAFLGLALGGSAAVTILLDAPTRLPAAHPLAAAAPDDRSAFGPPPADPAVHGEIVAGEVLSSARLPDPVPPAAASTEVVPGAALSPPAPRAGQACPDPPPEPPQEIHHPVRR